MKLVVSITIINMYTAEYIQHVREKLQFLHFGISPRSTKALVSCGGKIRHHLIIDSLINISAKNH